jgi:hypothetical protein
VIEPVTGLERIPERMSEETEAVGVKVRVKDTTSAGVASIAIANGRLTTPEERFKDPPLLGVLDGESRLIMAP